MESIKDLGQYTFPALLANAVKKFGDNPALSFVDGEPVTYKALAANVSTVQKMLIGLGLHSGSKIAIYSGSMPNWGAAFFAIVNSGAIAVPLLPDFSAIEVESVLGHCGVDALFVSARLYERISSLNEKLPPVIIRTDDFCILRGGEVVAKIAAAKNLVSFSINEALAESSVKSEMEKAPVNTTGVFASDFSIVHLPEFKVDENDTASIIYTSGTTGRSKGVELSHKNLVWNAVQCQTVHRVNCLDRCLSFLPLSHVYEFTIDFTMQIMNGACVYYLGRPPTVSALLPAFAKVRPTIVCAVPIIMEKIWKNKVLPEIEKNKIINKLYKMRLFKLIINRKAGKKLRTMFGGRLQFFGIGGAKVDTTVEHFMKDAKFPYAIGYGLTETSPLIAGSGPSITLPGTVGPVMDGVQMKILDPDPKTHIGEVVVRSPSVMKGYYKDSDLTAKSFTTESDSCGAGWFKTGDLGTYERKKGLMRLSLKGRSKNMILGPAGENIYPEDIEFVLNQHPLVSESLVVEDKGGLVALVHIDEEKLKAEAQKHGDIITNIQEVVAYQQQVILGEIQFFVNSKVNKASHINKVENVDEFEKTASQKIKRFLYSRKSNDEKKK